MTDNKPTMAGKRLNPLAIAPESSFYFILLIIVSITLVIDQAKTLNPVTMQAMDMARLINAADFDVSSPASMEAARYTYDWLWLESAKDLVNIAGIFLCVMILSGVIYLAYPTWIRKTRHLKIFTGATDAKFDVALKHLIEVSGVSPVPKIELASGSNAMEGQAFGTGVRYSLLLGNRIRLLLRQDFDKFRAIVLHELAHIVNSDIPRTYFAESVWIITIFLILVTRLIAFVIKQDVPVFLPVLPQFILVIITILLIRKGMLRVREFYADWKTVLWGAETPLKEILHSNAEKETARSKLSGFMGSFHPTAKQRLDALQNSDSLFTTPNETPIFVGVMLGIIFGAGAWLLQTFYLFGTSTVIISFLELWEHTQDLPIRQIITMLGLLVFVYIVILLTAAITFSFVNVAGQAWGSEVERETIANMLRANQTPIDYIKLWKPAFLVSIGFQLGTLLLPDNVYIFALSSSRFAQGFPRILILFGATAILAWLWLVYVRFYSRHAIGAYTNNKIRSRCQRIMRLLSSVLLAVFFNYVGTGQVYIESVILNNGFAESILKDLHAKLPWTLLPYIAILIFSWLILSVVRLIWRPKCPNCGEKIEHHFVVGRLCKHCGQSLTPWLFI